ncbi:MAG: hypothetical protein KGJ13_11360 [Patescibacteria group bacterium]|nr:hypothetical protein [Patescibacteria group bacterium]
MNRITNREFLQGIIFDANALRNAVTNPFWTAALDNFIMAADYLDACCARSSGPVASSSSSDMPDPPPPSREGPPASPA